MSLCTCGHALVQHRTDLRLAIACLIWDCDCSSYTERG